MSNPQSETKCCEEMAHAQTKNIFLAMSTFEKTMFSQVLEPKLPKQGLLTLRIICSEGAQLHMSTFEKTMFSQVLEQKLPKQGLLTLRIICSQGAQLHMSTFEKTMFSQVLEPKLPNRVF